MQKKFIISLLLVTLIMLTYCNYFAFASDSITNISTNNTTNDVTNSSVSNESTNSSNDIANNENNSSSSGSLDNTEDNTSSGKLPTTGEDTPLYEYSSSNEEDRKNKTIKRTLKGKEVSKSEFENSTYPKEYITIESGEKFEIGTLRLFVIVNSNNSVVVFPRRRWRWNSTYIYS